MNYTTFSLDLLDHVPLVVHRWAPDSPLKAHIVLVHGFGEHAARYAHVAEYFTQRGYAITAPDHRGHGRTAQDRLGHFERMDDLVEDVRRVTAQNFAPDQPLFLFGHSMGGLIALLYTLRYPAHLRGLVISAAYVNSRKEISSTQEIVMNALSQIAPRLGVVEPVNAAVLSRDPVEVEKYRTDPLVHQGRVTARVAAEMIRGGDYVRANAHHITLPAIVLHGAADRLAKPDFGQVVYDRLGSADKTLKMYDGAYHEILNDINKADVMRDIVDWLDVHLI
jgi:alpha-beta hydrolase superfamily lysophospholipase